ncbi:MAG: PKD domain-containing protein [Euryarchaeota archaeon]|nr:PKD domain-containing protein [Euryarchaeota archaeon]
MDSEGNIGADRSSFQIKNHEQPPPNLAPNKPSTPQGTPNGRINVEYTYTSSTTDPDGDQVYYLWDWGNGNNSGWLGPYNSGIPINTIHKWTVKGSYSIKVKAKDIHGNESVWSDSSPIKMPYSFNKPIPLFLELLFQRFPNAFPLLRHLLGY